MSSAVKRLAETAHDDDGADDGGDCSFPVAATHSSARKDAYRVAGP